MKKHSLEISLFLTILIILMFVFYGCGGTRKTETTKSETKDDRINIENHYESGTKIVLNDIFTFTPFDPLKPMILDGKKYDNAIISNDQTKTKEKYLKIKETKYVHTSREIIKNKTTDKTNYIYLWLGMFFILVIAVWAWFYFRKGI